MTPVNSKKIILTPTEEQSYKRRFVKFHQDYPAEVREQFLEDALFAILDGKDVSPEFHKYKQRAEKVKKNKKQQSLKD